LEEVLVNREDLDRRKSQVNDLKAEVEEHKEVVRNLMKYRKAVDQIGSFFYMRILTKDQHQAIDDVFRIIKEETGDKYGD
jgi:ribosome recycling factor